ncbi:TonB-dependent receptor [Colwellia sp. E150_009]
MNIYKTISAIVGLTFAGTSTYAQERGVSEDVTVKEKETEVIRVTSSRLASTLSTMPGSVTVVDQEELQKQLAVTSDLGAILGQMVPGMGTSSASPSNVETSLRGRKPVFFIDGVPITPTLNEVGREMRMIDPGAIERIEVVRGSSALYGNSAGAGFINYITGAGQKGATEIAVEIGSQFSVSEFGDGQRPSVRLSATGGDDEIDYRTVVFYEEIGGFFDSDGDRIAPIPNGFSGLADSKIYSLYGKIGIDMEEGRIEFSANTYNQKQDTKYTLENGDVSEGIKATAVLKGDDAFEEADQFHENSVFNLSYSHPDFLGSRLNSQLYYQNSKSVFDYSATKFPKAEKTSGQSDTTSDKLGVRIDLRTQLPQLNNGAELLWGIDILKDKTRADLVDGRTYAPPQELNSQAIFAQLLFEPIENLNLTIGVRHERSQLELKDFTSLLTYAESSIVKDDEGNITYAELSNVTGGTLDYDATPINIGVTYDLSSDFNVFAGFSQGFQITGVGRELRSWPEHVNVEILNPDPNLIDSYEIGARKSWDSLSGTFSVFYTDSSNGLSYRADPTNPDAAIVDRAGDKVYGFELTFDADLTENLSFGGTYAWLEGKADKNGDGSFDDYLQNRRIPPQMLSIFLEYDNGGDWITHLQGLYSGNRDRFPDSTAFWEGNINSFTTVDLSVSGKVGPGTLIIGLSNMLNEDYYTHVSESAQQDSRYSKAPGATASIRYEFKF